MSGYGADLDDRNDSGLMAANNTQDKEKLTRALRRLVDHLWQEFGTDLIENENDHLDQAYLYACGVLGIDPDRRADC